MFCLCRSTLCVGLLGLFLLSASLAVAAPISSDAAIKSPAVSSDIDSRLSPIVLPLDGTDGELDPTLTASEWKAIHSDLTPTVSRLIAGEAKPMPVPEPGALNVLMGAIAIYGSLMVARWWGYR